MATDLKQPGISRHLLQQPLPEFDKLLIGRGTSNDFLRRKNKDNGLQADLATLRSNQDKIRFYLEQQMYHLDYSYEEQSRQINQLTESFIASFWADNVGANVTDQVLLSPSTRGFIMTHPGSAVRIVLRSNAARTAGTMTAEMRKNGTKTGFNVVLDATNTTMFYTIVDQGKYIYDIGDVIDAVVSTVGWAPTTADIDTSIELVNA